MLYTIKYIRKGMENMLFLGVLQNNSGELNTLVEHLNLKDKATIQSNADLIKNWVKKDVNNSVFGKEVIDIFEAMDTNGKFIELLEGLELTVDYKKSGNKILLEKVINKISEYALARNNVVGETRTNISTEQNSGELPLFGSEKGDIILLANINKIINEFNEHDSKGDKVKVRELQQALNKQGSNLKVDGLWGKNTKKALENFKATSSLNTSPLFNISSSLDTSKLKYYTQGTDIGGNLSSQKHSENLSIDNNMTVIMDFNEHVLKGDKVKVRELQQALNKQGSNLKVDGLWGPNTKKALDNARSTLNGYNQNVSFEGVTKQLETTNNSVLRMQAQLEATVAINSNLTIFKENAKKGHSIVGIITTLFKGTKYEQFLSGIDETAGSYLNRLNDPKNQGKLKNAILHLQNPHKSISDDRIDESRASDTMEHIKGLLPWLAGIYVMDIPLPFMKEMMPGVNIQKSLQFKQWIQDGMPDSFYEYERTKTQKEINPQQEQNKLISMLSSLHLNDREKAAILRGDLSTLDENTQVMLQTYFEKILVPNLIIMSEESWNIFERGFLILFKDEKYTAVQKILGNFEHTKTLSREDIAFILQQMVEEGDLNKSIIDKQKSDADYMNQIKDNATELNKMGELLTLDSDLNALFRFLNNTDPKSLGLESQSDIDSYNQLMSILNYQPIDQGLLQNWKAKNPDTYKFIQGLNNPKKMQEYRLSKLENGSGLNKAKLESRLAHGGKLTGNSEQDRKTLFESTPDGKLSTFDYIYKGLIEKTGNTAVSREQLMSAMQDMQQVSINDIPDSPIVNTGRTSEAVKNLTSFKNLAAKGDKYIMKLSPIVNEYTFVNEAGNTETVSITTQAYLRPDCSNLLLVPNSVQVSGKEVSPKFIGDTLIQVHKFIPLVIPWTVFKGRHKTDTPSGEEPKPNTRPHETPNTTPPNTTPPNTTPPNTTPPNTTPPNTTTPNISTPNISTTPGNGSSIHTVKLGGSDGSLNQGTISVESSVESVMPAAQETQNFVNVAEAADKINGGSSAVGFPE